MRILLTAFEPFGGQSLNASQQVAREVAQLRLAGAQIELLELPVERLRAPQLALDAIARLRPDIVLLLGEAAGRAAITPERVAVNMDDFSIPDNAGNTPREAPVVAGGPAAFFSTLPLVALESALRAGGIPAHISNTAGTFVCNHLFYNVMHHLAATQSSISAGFVHLPLLPEQLAGLQNSPGLSRETLVQGARIILETCLEERRRIM